MFSMPPATTISASPARISAAPSMIAFRPEPHTRLIVVALVVSCSPAFSAAWRAGAWPAPPWRTWPMRTSSTWSVGTPARSTAARMATPPRVVAGVVERAPPNLPIGVRAAETMKTSPLGPWLATLRCYTGRQVRPRLPTRGPDRSAPGGLHVARLRVPAQLLRVRTVRGHDPDLTPVVDPVRERELGRVRRPGRLGPVILGLRQ